MKSSIVMTTYNGEKYLEEQIKSVVKQLDSETELVISDDGSTDNTLNILRPYTSHENVTLFKGPGHGVIQNFNSALSHTKGKYIFFCDQDDIWVDGKVKSVVKCFEDHPGTKVIVHDAFILTEQGVTNESIFENRKAKHGVTRNILFSTYYGCCMVVDRDFLNTILPLDPDVLYDQHIGNCAEALKCSYFLQKKLIYHREHTDNWSQKQTLANQVKIRIGLLKQLNQYKKDRSV